MIVLALSAASASAKRPPGTVYGGSSGADNPFALQVSADRKRLIRALVHVDTTCSDGNNLLWSGSVQFVSKLPSQVAGPASLLSPSTLPRNGKIRTTGVAVDDYGDTVGLTAQSLEGKISGVTATGTLQLKISLRDRASKQEIATCDTGVVHWSARAARGRIFAGLTADDRPVVLEVTADRLRVAHLRVSAAAGCQPQGAWWVGDDLFGFPISSTHSFGDTFDSGPYIQDDGTKVSLHYSIAGSVGKTGASGTYAVTVTGMDATGATTSTCTVPETRWKATS